MKINRNVNVVIVGSVLLILTLVLIKSFSHGSFRNNAAKWTSPSVGHSNIMTAEQMDKPSENLLIVNLDGAENDYKGDFNTIDIQAKSLLDRENRKKLRAHKGSIVLVSDDPALSARMWMLLSQMGYRNLFILGENIDNEVLKYKFQPDTLSRLEF